MSGTSIIAKFSVSLNSSTFQPCANPAFHAFVVVS